MPGINNICEKFKNSVKKSTHNALNYDVEMTSLIALTETISKKCFG